MSAQEQLEALIASPDVPDHIKRHFAADCAERALIIERERAGCAPDPRSIRLIEVLRLYIENPSMGKVLANARNAADMAFRERAARSGRIAATWSAVRSADKTAAYAASDASKGCARASADAVRWEIAHASGWAPYEKFRALADSAWDADCEWQLAHLQGLIEQHKKGRASLLSALREHAVRKQEAPQFGNQLEEVLFT